MSVTRHDEESGRLVKLAGRLAEIAAEIQEISQELLEAQDHDAGGGKKKPKYWEDEQDDDIEVVANPELEETPPKANPTG